MSAAGLPPAACRLPDLEHLKARHHHSLASFRLKNDAHSRFLALRDGAGIAWKGRIPDPFCSMRGVSSGLLDEGDSESNQSVSRQCTLKKDASLLLGLIREIQPLDVSQISKEASSDSIDAMKRTTSGMLGLLPSDQFYVTVETSREPLAKLLVSSMMTGYTLRNAEYRLCLQRSLELSEDDERERALERVVAEEAQDREADSLLELLSDERDTSSSRGGLEACEREELLEDVDIPESLGSLTEEAKGYVRLLQQKLASVSKELEECKLCNTGLQMQNIVGEEKNDLLDYLRALAPDKVAELSQPTSPDVEDVIQQVISELLDNPSIKLQSKGTRYGNGTNNAVNGAWEEGSQKFSALPLQFESAVVVNRDYLARLLFWCMLLGHHMRGLEYRLELSRTLSLSGDIEQ